MNTDLVIIIFLRTLFTKNENITKLKIKNKENKISHGRGNSLRNKVRGWVDLDSPDPLKNLSLPAERILNALPRCIAIARF